MDREPMAAGPALVGKGPSAAAGTVGREENQPVSGASASASRPGPGTELGAGYRAKKHDFLTIGLSCLPDEAFLGAVEQAVKTRSRLTVSFINPDYALKARRIPGLVDKINQFDIVLPDGWGIVVGARRLGIPIPNRQANDDICPKVFALSAERGFGNYLFGCEEGIPEQAAANLTASYPSLPIAGTLHGNWDVLRGHKDRYDQADVDMMVETINAANPDILHVSLRTPMQQNWVSEVAGRLNVPVIITGGSYLDHLAERVDWYPDWVVRMRLCWAYRLAREPRRLWKRYTLDLAAYGLMVLRASRRRRS